MAITTSRDYRAVKEDVHRRLRDRLSVGRVAQLSRDSVRLELAQLIDNMATWESVPITLPERERLSKEVLDEVFGLGPLEPLLADPTISDILVNSYKNVYIERKGRLERTPVQFRDDAHLMSIIARIVSGVGRRVDESSPIVDARLADGSRANAIIPPLAIDGPCLSIRRFGRHMLTADDLVENHTFTPPMLEFLRACVYARMNIILSGGPGSGKTTLLNVLSSFISKRERIVTIEDAVELRFHQDHVVRLETRPANIEGSGAIPARRLVINALRMRPDRIVIGEVRGEEALDMLQAMNTGHDGSLTTIHARAGYDALSRLETMVTMGGLDIPLPVIRAQIASAVDLVVQVSRLTDGTRKVTNIAEINGLQPDGTISLQEIFVFNKTGIGQDDTVLGEFISTGNRPRSLERLAASGVELPLSMFEPQEIQVYNSVVARLGDATDVSSQMQVAAALASKAVALGQLDRSEEQLQAYASLVERFVNSTELSLQAYVARALVGNGIALDRLNRREEAVQAYRLVVERFAAITELPLQEQVATALVSEGIALGHLGRTEEAIRAYDSVVERLGGASELLLLEQVARALVNKGLALGRLNRRIEAIQAYDTVVTRCAKVGAVSLQKQLARALLSKGVALSRLNRKEEAIEVYDTLIGLFDGADDLSLQQQIARALVSKAIVLVHLNNSEAAIQTYDLVLERFGSATEELLRGEVTQALAGKGALLVELGRGEEEIEALNSVKDQLRHSKGLLVPGIRN
jgi:pilus assembly protein CpaF